MENNIAPFRVGQKVVRLDDCKYIKKGEVVTIGSIEMCNCGKWRVSIVEHPFDMYGYQCINCKNTSVTGLFIAKYFAPIQESYTDITAEIASQQSITEERPDKILIPETVN